MQKVDRLIAIERIIEEKVISSHEELLQKLKEEGIECTQATLSRNLRQLGVIKVPDGRGSYRYSLSAGKRQATDTGFSIISAIRSVIDANRMIVMRTEPGYANSVGVIIDRAGRYEIAGTIAGDDTLLIIPRDNVNISQTHSCLEMILPGLHNTVRKA